MHNLALELSQLGHNVTGSDDEIYDPAYSRLKQACLLPDTMGWNSERIHRGIDVVILGMHALLDNPELKRAEELGLKVVSFPRFVGDEVKASKRIVICGSHGKSTITGMIMHALRAHELSFDFLLGGLLEGFDTMVRLRNCSIFVAEGDEYLSSRADRISKMMHYKGNIVVITGIEWDHMNVFPTFDIYKNQFHDLVVQTNHLDGEVIAFANDEVLNDVLDDAQPLRLTKYQGLHQSEDGSIIYEGKEYGSSIFGQHNMANLNAALLVCQRLGITPNQFLTSMKDFHGVGKRLERISEDPIVYLDYAHAPSKVKATVEAVANRHKNRKVVGIYELHTYSSLNVDFLPHYKGSMAAVDHCIIFVDDHALMMKRMPQIPSELINQSFNHVHLEVVTSREELELRIARLKDSVEVFLFMSSGKFGGMNLEEVFEIHSK